MSMFEWMEGKEIIEFIGYLLCAFAMGGLIIGSAVSAVDVKNKGIVQAQPIDVPSYNLLQLQQMTYQNSECGVCLPKCFQVYNMTRQFGKTVNAVEAGWIK